MLPSKEFVVIMNRQFSRGGRNLINHFFICFSRFECALKTSANFYTVHDEKVEANWDRFCAAIRDDFDYSKPKKLREAVVYILQHPPRIQNKVNQQIVWRDRIFPPNTPDINKLSISIRGIRNNLFHGGKFDGNFQPDVSRNYRLLKSAVIILNHWLTLNDEVRHNFMAPIA